MNDLLKYFCKSLIERYYKCDDIVHSTIIKTFELKKIPSLRMSRIESEHLIELVAFSHDPTSRSCFESFVIKTIYEDMTSGGDGSLLYEMFSRKLAEAEHKDPKQKDYIHEAEIPRLIRRDAKTKHSETIADLMKSWVNKGHKDSVEEICTRYPLVLNIPQLSDSKCVKLSRGDLASGVLISGTAGSGANQVQESLLAQLMKTGGGMIHFDNNHYMNSFLNFYSFAYELQRERDVVLITIENQDAFKESDYRNFIKENKLVYVMNRCMEKSPIGIHNSMAKALQKIGRALNERRQSFHTPFTFSANDGFHYDPVLLKAFSKVDNLAKKNRIGRIYCDYSDSYHLTLKKSHHYLYHVLLATEGDESNKQHGDRRRKFSPGQCLISMDEILILDNGYAAYKAPEPVEKVILHQ
ncbi:hypothetical protein [Vibrio sp. D431a]|uniref:hypothetical protein n=1 Tax=Vibrio sp. D431a TaxID=2837388 RepID=UPI00255279FA|nr:hypothetical protein [Vibrio sp. D431a]MDK9789987.1 hypothetical protein [Vibrio sp. D431a]